MKKPHVNDDPSAARVTVSTRTSVAGRDQIDAFAAAENRTRSTMARILLAEAVAARLRSQGR